MSSAQSTLFQLAAGQTPSPAKPSSDAWEPWPNPPVQPFVGDDPQAIERRVNLYAKLGIEKSIARLHKLFCATAQQLGPDCFESVARKYLGLVPTPTPYNQWLGHRFAQFLSEPPMRKYLWHMPWIADAAQLDWARVLADRAPEEEPLQFSHLRSVDQSQWGQLHVTWLGSVQRVDSPYDLQGLVKSCPRSAPANSGFFPKSRPRQQTLSGVGDLQLNQLSAPPATRHWVIARSDQGAECYELPAAQARVFDALRYPLSLSEVSEVVATWSNEDAEQAAEYTVTWIRQWSSYSLLRAAVKTSLPPIPLEKDPPKASNDSAVPPPKIA